MRYLISSEVLWLREGAVVHMRKPNTETGITLEGSAAYIWGLLSEPFNLEELVERMVARFAVDRDTAIHDTENFLNTLLAKGYLEEYSPTSLFAP